MVVTSGLTQEAPDKRRIPFFGRDNNQAQPPSAEPCITFYLSPKSKDRKRPLLTLRDVTQAYAIYPERPELINKSTLMKIEGTYRDEEVAMAIRKREGYIFTMFELETGVITPELETGVPRANETIRWLIGIVAPYFIAVSTHVWQYSYS